jgi:hypothetical protein
MNTDSRGENRAYGRVYHPWMDVKDRAEELSNINTDEY